MSQNLQDADQQNATPDLNKHAEPGAPMTHRQIMETLTGLLTGMFVAILSSTIVANALPTIISDLHAGQTAYSWVITATLLAMTVTTPIWGKLSDLVDKKLLVQISLVIFVVGSIIAGLAANVGELIAARTIQGVGAGGMTALTQTIMAVMISPRERGRYGGYMSGLFAVGTVVGPLVGGAIVDTSWLGWRWCFFIGIPVAAVALVVLQKTMRLPMVKRQTSVDWLGALLVAAATSLLLIWISFAGDKYAWLSWQTGVMIGGAVVLVALLLLTESKTSEPIIPLYLFGNRTIVLAVVGSLVAGVAMYAGTTFLSQYFQLARDASPTEAGLLTLPMIFGLAIVSIVSGRLISRTGRWKIVLVIGSVLLVVGVTSLGTARADTPYGLLAVYMFCVGAGVGMTMQNLVLAVQNQVRIHEIGAASATVAFMRSLGGAIGVAALGAVMANSITRYTESGLARLGIPGSGVHSGSSLPSLSALSAPVRSVVEDAYGHGVADAFLCTAPLAVLALVAVLFIREVPLRTTNAPDPIVEAAGPRTEGKVGHS
ncbi:MDR family MFS transporter [Nocardia pseudovaccinii]|uniref:MDR family MFS transporter n=1 Tax=Nocardia pseudovaccinii TaxID=189540 RepID=UPI000B100B38|nr:MDR family MFS transporter [Nocardia pseudovaccinii]